MVVVERLYVYVFINIIAETSFRDCEKECEFNTASISIRNVLL